MNKKAFAILSFVCVCILSLSFLFSQGTRDTIRWKQWIDGTINYGVIKGYMQTHVQYPPLSTVILASVPGISKLFNINMFIAFKLLIYFFLLLTAFLFLGWTKSLYFATLLQFSLILNTMTLCYIDIFFAPALILAFAAIERNKMPLAVSFFLIACLVKWQPLIIAPFIFIHLVNIQHIKNLKTLNFRKIGIHMILPTLIITGTIVGIFGPKVFQALFQVTSRRVLSGNALNFNWILTYNLHWLFPDFYGPLRDGASWFFITYDLRVIVIPRLLFIFFYGVCFVAFFRQEKTFKNLLLYSIAGYLAYFTFNIDVHENHLFLVCILGIILYWLDNSYKEMAFGIMLLTNLNLFIFYGINGRSLPFSLVIGMDITVIMAFLYVIFFFMVLYPLIPRKEGEAKELKAKI